MLQSIGHYSYSYYHYLLIDDKHDKQQTKALFACDFFIYFILLQAIFNPKLLVIFII